MSWSTEVPRSLWSAGRVGPRRKVTSHSLITLNSLVALHHTVFTCSGSLFLEGAGASPLELQGHI